MKAIKCCGECGYYNWGKHRCQAGAKKENDPRDPFYDDCPLADAVEVVHCKDCKHCRKHVHCYVCNYHIGALDDALDGFCSHGERRATNAAD